VNHKSLRRCLREWNLALQRQVARPRPSGVRMILKGAKGKLNLLRGWQLDPFQALYTDFTEVKYADGMRKAYLMAMIDPGSGWVEGWAVGKSANRELALKCWEAAKEGLAEVGRGTWGLVVHHDQDSVYTSYRWLLQLLNRGQGSGLLKSAGRRTTRGWSRSGPTLKGRTSRCFFEATTLEGLEGLIARQMRYYNYERRHSRLDYQSPIEHLIDKGFIPETLVEKGVKNGSASGAQALHFTFPIFSI